jgi:hypothetical protein
MSSPDLASSRIPPLDAVHLADITSLRGFRGVGHDHGGALFLLVLVLVLLLEPSAPAGDVFEHEHEHEQEGGITVVRPPEAVEKGCAPLETKLKASAGRKPSLSRGPASDQVRSPYHAPVMDRQ